MGYRLGGRERLRLDGVVELQVDEGALLERLATRVADMRAQFAALIYPGAFSAESLRTLRQGWKRIHELTGAEARQFMGNGIVVNGRLIIPRLTQNLQQILAQEGLTAVVLDTSEFEKSGGSVFCMKAFIE